MRKAASTLMFVITVILSFGLQNNLKGQKIVRIKWITGPVEFDGVPEEAAWEALDLFDLTMHRPNYGAEPSDKSEVRIGYDNEFLWIGASLFMKDASRIFAVTKKRDEKLSDYDAFGIILDTYKDNENGQAFFTTPTGIRTDYAISNDETDTYPAVDPKYGNQATNKPSLARTIEIEGARPSKPVYISPYVIGGLS